MNVRSLLIFLLYFVPLKVSECKRGDETSSSSSSSSLLEMAQSIKKLRLNRRDPEARRSLSGQGSTMRKQQQILQEPIRSLEEGKGQSKGTMKSPQPPIIECDGCNCTYVVTNSKGKGTGKGTGNGKGTTENGKGTGKGTGTENGKGTTENGKGTTGNGKGTTENGKGTTENGKGTTGNGKGTTGNGKGTTGNGKGTTENGKGTTENVSDEGKGKGSRSRMRIRRFLDHEEKFDTTTVYFISENCTDLTNVENVTNETSPEDSPSRDECLDFTNEDFASNDYIGWVEAGFTSLPCWRRVQSMSEVEDGKAFMSKEEGDWYILGLKSQNSQD